MRAAEKAEETSSPIIELSDDDYAVLSKAVEAPERGVFGKEAPPVVARLMLAFVEAIEGATTERPNMEQIVEASHE